MNYSFGKNVRICKSFILSRRCNCDNQDEDIRVRHMLKFTRIEKVSGRVSLAASVEFLFNVPEVCIS